MKSLLPGWLVQPEENGDGRRPRPLAGTPAASWADAGPPTARPPTRAPVAARPLMKTRRPTSAGAVASCSRSTASSLDWDQRERYGGGRAARRPEGEPCPASTGRLGDHT